MPLRKLTTKITDGSHQSPKSNDSFTKKYITVKDMDDFGNINFNNCLRISDEDYKILVKGGCQPLEGDVLLSKDGTVGKTYTVRGYNDFVLLSSIAIIRPLQNFILPEYLELIFKMNSIMQIIKRLMGGTALQRIVLLNLKRLPIPLLPIDVQSKLITLYSTALNQYKTKVLKSLQILNEESDLIIQNLGLNIKLNQIHRKKFIIKYSQTTNRLDPLYYSKDLFAFLEGIPHQVLPILKVMRYMKTGFATGRENQDRTGNGVIQIRPTNIDDDRNLIFDKNVYIDREELSSRHGDILCRGEVLFNNTNSQELVGKTTYFDIEGAYFCSNHITRIGVDSSIVEPEYLCLILNLYQRNKIFYHLCTNWNNQSGVNVKLLRKIDIPVPDLDIQRGIISEVNRRKQLAAQLRQEAIQGLEAAKAEVERMILGE